MACKRVGGGSVGAMTDFLSISSEELQADISPFGAALARVWLRGHRTSLVLGLPRPEDYALAPHGIGVIVAPIAGRVSKARVRINGRDHRMEANTPPDCLHSGSEAAQARLWEVVERSAARIALRCVLPDGACGLPGQRSFTARYEIVEKSLTIAIETRSDADTLVNATSHAYWTLDAAGDLSSHRLTVHTGRMVETGADLIPTGRILDVTGTDFDFSAPRDPTGGPPLDGCFCFDRASGDSLRPMLRLQSVRSGLSLRVDSNQPGVVLYTGQNLPRLDSPPRSPPIGPYSGLAIEPQGWPDAANQPDFPSIFLNDSDTLRQISRFSFGTP